MTKVELQEEFCLMRNDRDQLKNLSQNLLREKKEILDNNIKLMEENKNLKVRLQNMYRQTGIILEEISSIIKDVR